MIAVSARASSGFVLLGPLSVLIKNTMKKHNTSFSVLEHKESSQVIDLINIYVPPIYGAIVVFYTPTCYIHEKLCIFVYNCLN